MTACVRQHRRQRTPAPYSLLDEIFGPGQPCRDGRLAQRHGNNPTNIAVEHEYIVCFANAKAALEKVWKVERVDGPRAIKIKAHELIAEYGNDPPELTGRIYGVVPRK